jgi:hypothetical protein
MKTRIRCVCIAHGFAAIVAVSGLTPAGLKAGATGDVVLADLKVSTTGAVLPPDLNARPGTGVAQAFRPASAPPESDGGSHSPFTPAAFATDIKVDLNNEQVGKPPVAFEPMVGTWVIAQDGPDKVVMIDGRPWVATKDNPTKLLIESARRLYGTSNEELMDNAKQFAYYPVAVLKGVESFSNGSISVKFKTISGEADRASGILFNVKPNGDWLAIRYNDTENNIALWEFHNGIRRPVKFGPPRQWMLDRAQWHELKMTVDGAGLTAFIDGKLALEYTLGSQPGPGRNNAPPNPICSPPTIPCSARRWPAGSACGQRPTARATSKITW